MKSSVVAFRSIRFYAGTNLALGMGLAVASAVVTGALIVGDSMRQSLQHQALDRLGDVRSQLTGDHFFTQRLVDSLPNAAPAIVARGGAVHATTASRSENVQILGITDAFWSFDHATTPAPDFSQRRTAVITEPLARELGASVGDDILLRVGNQHTIATETLLGRRDNVTLTLRTRVSAILPEKGLASFSSQTNQAPPRNAFVNLSDLQAVMKQEGMINTVLTKDGIPEVESIVRESLTPEDLGLSFRIDLARGYVGVESNAMLIPPALQNLVTDAARRFKGIPVEILTHLANGISRKGGPSEEPASPPADANAKTVPYSTVTGVPETFAFGPAFDREDNLFALGAGEIMLNDWAAADLGARPGDQIELTYYLNDDFGELREDRHTFTVKAVLPMTGPSADGALTPHYPGITNTRRISDWDPPFPVDLKRIRDKDESYWDEYRATPKAIISLGDADRLWTESTRRFGTRTSVQCVPGRSVSVFTFYRWLVDAVLESVTLEQAGLRVEDLRERAMQSGRGSTDFGGLFIGFSFFLILSAAFLVALLLKLTIAQRSSEIGLMLATGFAPLRVTRLLFIEFGVVSSLGIGLGLPLALGYAWLMLAGLRSWWSDAVNAPFLALYPRPLSFVAGAAIAMFVAWLAAWLTLRQIRRFSPNFLLSGGTPTTVDHGGRRPRLAGWIAAICWVAAPTLILSSSIGGKPSPSASFFGAGGLMLTAALLTLLAIWRKPQAHLITRPGRASLLPLARRQATRFPDRSLLTVGLMASAVFLITALQAFRLDGVPDPTNRRSGTGGYSLYAESAVPIVYALNGKRAVEDLDLADDTAAVLQHTTIMPFRLKPGDETSCLNLYDPSNPRIIGATSEFLARGGFRFKSSLADDPTTRENPWLLLNREWDDGTIPAIGDEASVLWQLHSGLNKVMEIEAGNGSTRRIRFVALLSGSTLQSEIVIAEPAFKEIFPRISGYGFFLVDDAEVKSEQKPELLPALLERDLSVFAFDVNRTSERLAGFQSVQNTYLSTFQTLGGLGLILGSFGLTAVLLRNIWERRGELALLQAVGFTNSFIERMMLLETAFLVVAGIAAGLIPAMVAVAPQLIDRGLGFPWLALMGIIAGVLVAGIAPGVLAVRRAFKAPLIENLRRE